ncbi:MAG: universal stress protein [Candidatus Korobacteraceae bacterium]|jgi:nucleotide-binding universal stress UspA family protein
MSRVVPSGDLRLNSVLIATDFSEASEKALRHGLAIARHYGARLYLVHVVSSLGFTLVGPDAINEAVEAVRRDAHQMQDRLAQSGALAGVRHKVIVLAGDVCEELEKVIRQEQVDLVVIGTHARRGLGKLLLGSVAEAIFRRTECLVLTVGPGSLQDSPVGSTRAIRPFLFATSFSEASLHALPYAISAANHFGTQLVLLHVVAVVPMPEGVTRPSADDVMQAREKTHTARIRQLTEWTLQTPKLAIEPEFLVEFGLPSEKILQAANDLKADAIVLGLHRSTHIGTAAHMPWATAYEVVCGAGCSVLTVRN